jgi:hypothetical protein
MSESETIFRILYHNNMDDEFILTMSFCWLTISNILSGAKWPRKLRNILPTKFVIHKQAYWFASGKVAFWKNRFRYAALPIRTTLTKES